MQGEDKKAYLDVPFGLWMVEVLLSVTVLLHSTYIVVNFAEDGLWLFEYPWCPISRDIGPQIHSWICLAVRAGAFWLHKKVDQATLKCCHHYNFRYFLISNRVR